VTATMTMTPTMTTTLTATATATATPTIFVLLISSPILLFRSPPPGLSIHALNFHFKKLNLFLKLLDIGQEGSITQG